MQTQYESEINISGINTVEIPDIAVYEQHISSNGIKTLKKIALRSETALLLPMHILYACSNYSKDGEFLWSIIIEDMLKIFCKIETIAPDNDSITTLTILMESLKHSLVRIGNPFIKANETWISIFSEAVIEKEYDPQDLHEYVNSIKINTTPIEYKNFTNQELYQVIKKTTPDSIFRQLKRFGVAPICETCPSIIENHMEIS